MFPDGHQFVQRNLRYEIKFVIDRVDYLSFERWLAGKPFVSRSFLPRTVRSIYFDTHRFSTANDNILGLPNRRKYRIRSYGNEKSIGGGANVEIKGRIGRLGFKVVAPANTRSDDATRMSPAEITEMFCADRTMGDYFPKGMDLWPTLGVEYLRHYHKGPEDIRITVDERIGFVDFVSDDPTRIAGHRDFGKNVVEFKFRPEVKDQAAELMSDLPFYPTRSSKYVTGLALFGHVLHI